MRRRILCLAVLVVLVGVMQTEIALAVKPDQVDNFDNSTTTKGWTSGNPNVSAPVNVPNGGPFGDGDNFLNLSFGWLGIHTVVDRVLVRY